MNFTRLQTKVCVTLMVAALQLVGASSAHSQTNVVVQPVGVFATIDTSRTIGAIQILNSGKAYEKSALLSEIESKPEFFAPPAFYAASREFAARGDLDKALFWFYAGQLRARFDANRCTDVSARSAVGALNMQMPDSVRKHQFKIVDRLEALVRSVLEWDERTPRSYDHRWINLHGMDAIRSGLGQQGAATNLEQLSLPEAQWGSILKKTRDEWLGGFLQALPQLRKVAEQQGLR